MSLLALRCASSPFLVPEKILNVGSLRTLSCPDTSPGLIPGLSIALDFISFHFWEPFQTPIVPATPLSREAVLYDGRALSWHSTHFLCAVCVTCGSIQEWRSWTARYRTDGHNYVHPAVPMLLRTYARLKRSAVHQLYVKTQGRWRTLETTNRIKGG